MSVALPLFVLILLTHVAILVSSLHRDRFRRFACALVILVAIYPLTLLGGVLSPTDNTLLHWLELLLSNTPYYMPFVSFLVYLRGVRRVRG